MDIYFILWFAIQYYFIYFVGLTIPALAIQILFSCFPCLSARVCVCLCVWVFVHMCVCAHVYPRFEHFLTLGHYQTFQAHLYVSCCIPSMKYFSEDPQFLSLEKARSHC